MSLSSPNAMIWHYFKALRRLAASACDATNGDDAREIVALCMIMIVTVVSLQVTMDRDGHLFRSDAHQSAMDGIAELFVRPTAVSRQKGARRYEDF